METTLEVPSGLNAALPFPADERLRRRAFWTTMACFLVHGLVVSTWVSRIASVKSALGLSDGALGLALLGTAIGSVTAIPICGGIVARYGSRRTAQWTAAGFCMSLVAIAFARDGQGLFAALLLYGAMAGANDVAMNAHAVATEKLLGTPTISRFHSMFSIGGIAGASLGAAIAGRGLSPAVHLVGASAVILLFTMAATRGLVDTRNGAGHAARASLRRIPRALIALSAIGFCIFLSEGAIADWTAVYLKQILGAGEGLAPVGYAVFSAAMAVFRLTGDAITLRLGRARVIRYGGSLAAAGLTFALLVPSPYWAMAGFAAAGAGFSSIIPLVFAAGGRIQGISEGAGVATVSGLGYLGFLVGPPAIGFLSEWTSLRVGLFLLVALSLTAASLVGLVARGPADPLAE
ncbi:MAG: major facilitator superfamily 1 [Candidatus Solibacter sp.]|nr:major facilitator superfamily 1 [Candidatus Solibacter sp.]